MRDLTVIFAESLLIVERLMMISTYPQASDAPRGADHSLLTWPTMRF
jgi:hypothetical protein